LSSPGLEPGTLSVLDSRDNPYTTKTFRSSQSPSDSATADRTLLVANWRGIKLKVENERNMREEEEEESKRAGSV
jgi:hypothetical protein